MHCSRHQIIGQQTPGQSVARTRRPGRVSGGCAWLLLVLGAAGCGELHFVPSPYTPRKVELVYSSQEDVTIARWRVDGEMPLADTRFELLGPNGFQPIDFSQSVFTGGLTECADGLGGTCAQYVLRGEYQMAPGARPIQAVHDVYGVLPGNVPTQKTLSTTLSLESFFPPQNQMVYLNFPIDRISREGPYVFPRGFERALWPTNGLCLSDTAPDDVTFLPLDDSGGFPPEGPLTDEGMYCVGARPVPADGGPVVLLQKRIATQPEVVTKTHVFVPPIERSPVIYQIILDLEIPVADRCAEVIQEIEAKLAQYMSGADYPVPVHKLPTINLADDGSSRCAQTNGRVLKAPEMAFAIRQLVTSLSGDYFQVHLLYFNNLDAPLPQALVASVTSLVAAVKSPIADKERLEPYAWMFGPPGGAVPMPEPNWWAYWIWQTADESFEMRLDSYQIENLPRTTQLHKSSEPVPLLTDEEVAAHEGDLIKFCPAASVLPMAQLPFPHTIQEPTFTITAADPPAYTVSIREQKVVRAIDFVEERVIVPYQICTRYCVDHGFVNENNEGVESWATSRACAGAGY